MHDVTQLVERQIKLRALREQVQKRIEEAIGRAIRVVQRELGGDDSRASAERLVADVLEAEQSRIVSAILDRKREANDKVMKR